MDQFKDFLRVDDLKFDVAKLKVALNQVLSKNHTTMLLEQSILLAFH